MNTEVYRKKGESGKTQETGRRESQGGSRFVIHKHEATHPHYDFRLEIGGVLKSWAVPKGVPNEPGLRRLAIEVEDHPVEYIDFAGVIPEEEYGAGTVEVWDRGELELTERTPNYLKFTLRGKRLSGGFILIRMDARNWLIMRQRQSVER
jgi:bifunctional non-homologous end joining protein LigD